MLEISATGPKLKVNLRFIQGPQAGQIIDIDPEKSLTVFGCLSKEESEKEIPKLTNLPASEVQYETLLGNRVAKNHM